MNEFDHIYDEIKSNRKSPARPWQAPTDALTEACYALSNSLNDGMDTEASLERLLKVGEVLREGYWDFALPDLLDGESEYGHDYEFAVLLLLKACALPASEEELKHALDIFRKTPELANVRERITEIRRQLEEQCELPWSPPMTQDAFRSAVRSIKGERAVKTALEKGDWESDPEWEETKRGTKRVKRRYRSKNPDEQRKILDSIRAYRSQLDS